ncbi:glycerate kinase type-2 family protein [Leptospira adleri]|uniref:glycerate kinase type-2 family protein n=1 Tax=Leptospira adleri TaxID=2023186 RepID=UPI0010834AEA|nr:glycerate kinase [Leptospira adleri]TGM57917.1 glycerate kinase [Leptospira adleri]
MFHLDISKRTELRTDSPESVLFHLGTKAIQTSLPQKAVAEALRKLSLTGRIVLISIGKAAYPMALAATEICKDQIQRGLILTKYGHAGKALPPLETIEAGHPIPDQKSLLGGRRIFELCSDLKEEDTVLVLLSGGGSSLAEIPKEGIDLQDLVLWNRKLLESGAPIEDVNEIRILLSSLKGGGLLSRILPAKSATLILSDVIGDDLSKVASGPTIPSPVSKNSILRIFQQYDILPDQKIAKLLEEKSKIGRDGFFQEIDPSRNFVFSIGNISSALDAVRKECERHKISVLFLTSSLSCEAKEAGSFLAEIAKEYSKNIKHPLLILCGGETIVTHDGTGKGGRNQELALSFAKRISGLSGICLLSLATDGTDGPTDAAGAFVDGKTWGKIGLESGADRALKEHRSYEALSSAEALVFTGPTGTNVNDIQFVWISPGEKS